MRLHLECVCIGAWHFSVTKRLTTVIHHTHWKLVLGQCEQKVRCHENEENATHPPRAKKNFIMNKRSAFFDTYASHPKFGAAYSNRSNSMLKRKCGKFSWHCFQLIRFEPNHVRRGFLFIETMTSAFGMFDETKTSTGRNFELRIKFRVSIVDVIVSRDSNYYSFYQEPKTYWNVIQWNLIFVDFSVGNDYAWALHPFIAVTVCPVQCSWRRF